MRWLDSQDRPARDGFDSAPPPLGHRLSCCGTVLGPEDCDGTLQWHAVSAQLRISDAGNADAPFSPLLSIRQAGKHTAKKSQRNFRGSVGGDDRD